VHLSAPGNTQKLGTLTELIDSLAGADLDAWLAEVKQAVISKIGDGPVQL